MALALNNLKRVDMPLNKETKPNQNHLHYRNMKCDQLEKNKNPSEDRLIQTQPTPRKD